MKSIIKELGEKFDGDAKKPLVESYDEKNDRSKMVNELVNMEENLVENPSWNPMLEFLGLKEKTW